MSTDKQAIYAESIRGFVRTWFERLGASKDCGIAETLLIRNGYFCGRRYRAGELEAVWFFEEDQLKIYGTDGSVAHVFDSSTLMGDQLSEAA